MSENLQDMCKKTIKQCSIQLAEIMIPGCRIVQLLEGGANLEINEKKNILRKFSSQKNIRPEREKLVWKSFQVKMI